MEGNTYNKTNHLGMHPLGVVLPYDNAAVLQVHGIGRDELSHNDATTSTVQSRFLEGGGSQVHPCAVRKYLCASATVKTGFVNTVLRRLDSQARGLEANWRICTVALRASMHCVDGTTCKRELGLGF
jgi:hypothetical protein